MERKRVEAVLAQYDAELEENGVESIDIGVDVEQELGEGSLERKLCHVRSVISDLPEEEASVDFADIKKTCDLHGAELKEVHGGKVIRESEEHEDRAPRQVRIDHLLWMCLNISKVKEGSLDGQNRWLGFIHGALWSEEILILEDIYDTHSHDLLGYNYWLGFCQGVLWVAGIHTVEELKQHNLQSREVVGRSVEG